MLVPEDHCSSIHEVLGCVGCVSTVYILFSNWIEVRQPTAERIDGDVDLQLLASGNGLGLNGDDAALNEAAPDIVYKLSIKNREGAQ